MPLAGLDDMVFGGWDIFPGERLPGRAQGGKVLDPGHIEPVREEMEAIVPMPAVFDERYVKRLTGHHVKTGRPRWTWPSR